MRLYELTAEYAALMDTIYDSEPGPDGEINPELVRTLESLRDDIRHKAECICKIMADLYASESALYDEIARMEVRLRRIAKQRERMKDWLQDSLESIGMDKLDAGSFRLSICASPPSVDITDLAAVPAKYDKVQERQVVKADIARDLKAGIEVPGCVLVQSRHLRIK